MASTNDITSRMIESEPATGEAKHLEQQVHGWLGSLDKLMQAVEKSPMDEGRKSEILMHMAVIREELEGGQWPALGERAAVTQLAQEVGDLERVAQDWQVLSIRLANWVKAISDSLGVR